MNQCGFGVFDESHQDKVMKEHMPPLAWQGDFNSIIG
jgi:hypothetical protein